jgi:hypothetical protein
MTVLMGKSFEREERLMAEVIAGLKRARQNRDDIVLPSSSSRERPKTPLFDSPLIPLTTVEPDVAVLQVAGVRALTRHAATVLRGTPLTLTSKLRLLANGVHARLQPLSQSVSEVLSGSEVAGQSGAWTVKASVALTGLEEAKGFFFGCRTVTQAGMGNFSQVLAFVVQVRGAYRDSRSE